MRPEDLDHVFMVEQSVFPAPWPIEILHDCLRAGFDCRVVDIACPSGRTIVAYIISRYLENTCHVFNLSVAPLFQNKGYGTFLLRHVMDSFLVPNIDKISLNVRKSNTSARCFYNKIGFVQVMIKRGYYRDKQGIEDAIVLQRCIE